MTSLLRLLRDHSDAVEADLARYYHVDLRDRWRLDDSGRPRLTLRMIAVRVKHLPLDSAVARVVGGDGFTTTDYLLMDLFHGWTGKPHPMREAKKQGAALDPARVRKINAARKRMRDRIEAGLQPE